MNNTVSSTSTFLFVLAEKMKPDGWKENRLYIAKCHLGRLGPDRPLNFLDSVGIKREG